MTKMDVFQLIKSIQKDLELMDGPNWSYLSVATRTRVQYSYRGKCYRLYHLFVNEIIKPIAEVVKIITDFIIQLINEIGKVLIEVGMVCDV